MVSNTTKKSIVREDKSNLELKKIFKKSLKLLDKSENDLRDIRKALKKTVIRLSIAARGNDDNLDSLLDKIKRSVNDGIDLHALETGLDEIFVTLNQQVTVNGDVSSTTPSGSVQLKQSLQAIDVTFPDGEYKQRFTEIVEHEVSESELAERLSSLINDLSSDLDKSNSLCQKQKNSIEMFLDEIGGSFHIDREDYDIDNVEAILNALAKDLAPYARNVHANAEISKSDPVVNKPVVNKPVANKDVLSSVLTKLVEQLDLNSIDSKTRSKLINEFATSDNDPRKWLSHITRLSDYINNDIATLQNDKRDLSSFIVKISSQLDSIEGYVKQNRDVQMETACRSSELHDSIDTSFGDIRKGVDEADEISQLKQDIEAHISTIQQNIDAHRRREEAEAQVSQEEYKAIMKELQESKRETEILQNELEASREKLLRDTLTGLPNRLAYDERINMEKNRRQRTKEPLCIAIWDIDDFKRINDNYGHDAGDRVLKLFSRIIVERIRKVDMFARIGGEEFVLIMPDTSPEKALVLNDKLRESLEQYKFHYEGALCPVTSSIGIAFFDDDSSANDVYIKADKALYHSKKSGKNRCTVYSDEFA